MQKIIVGDDYQKLFELSIIFLEGDNDLNIYIKPAGDMHQARWIVRSIYSLQICWLRRQTTTSTPLLFHYCQIYETMA